VWRTLVTPLQGDEKVGGLFLKRREVARREWDDSASPVDALAMASSQRKEYVVGPFEDGERTVRELRNPLEEGYIATPRTQHVWEGTES